MITNLAQLGCNVVVDVSFDNIIQDLIRIEVKFGAFSARKSQKDLDAKEEGARD
jgi:hypothetical protein